MEQRQTASAGVIRPERDDTARTAGQLKIFFGYAAGTGKLCAMLRAARRARQAGTDVVIGWVPAYCSAEAAALLEGLERLDGTRDGGAFDLDAALRRRPRLLVIDGLARRNGAGCRHLKRCQDVQELLRAGIDVYTTLDVQQLESLNDMVVSITGIETAERIPDSFFDAADQVELVDPEPSELLRRMRGAQQPPYAYDGKTLSALRALMLRRAADRVDRAPVSAENEVRPKTGEHILTCISGAPSNAKVIRTAARMADAFHGSFTALFVETPDLRERSPAEHQQLRANMRLAEELGARISTVYGDDPAIQIAEYARVSGITKIVLGRSPQRRVPFAAKNLMDRLNELAPDLDIYVIPDRTNERADRPRRRPVRIERLSAEAMLRMLLILAVCTLVGSLFSKLGFSTADIIPVYILGVLVVAMVTGGRSCSLLASVLAVLIFNFFFTYPYFSLMSSPSYVVTFAVMFVVALLGSSLTTRVKQQALQSAGQAYRTQILLETSQKLQKAEGTEAILSVAATQLNRLLERDLVMYPVGEDGQLQTPIRFPVRQGGDLSPCLTVEERSAAEWVLQNNKHAGATTSTLPNARCLYLAVRGSSQVQAVTGIAVDPGRKPEAFEKNLMVAILDECGLALEKDRADRAKRQAEETARQEALRADLLRAISHDLRTPLTSISGSAGILLENGDTLDGGTRRRLYTSIYDDAMWLINLVENLLSITRMENGTMKLNVQPELLEEVFGEALTHLDRSADKHEISVEMADDLLMADMDAHLIVQVIINIVNNAVKYTQEGSKIVVSARQEGEDVLVQITDDGPGISDSDKDRLFEMFYTADGKRGDGRRGLGLGLALCKSIVLAHGGTISVSDRPPHGACFSFTLHRSEVCA